MASFWLGVWIVEHEFGFHSCIHHNSYCAVRVLEDTSTKNDVGKAKWDAWILLLWGISQGRHIHFSDSDVIVRGIPHMDSWKLEVNRACLWGLWVLFFMRVWDSGGGRCLLWTTEGGGGRRHTSLAMQLSFPSSSLGNLFLALLKRNPDRRSSRFDKPNPRDGNLLELGWFKKLPKWKHKKLLGSWEIRWWKESKESKNLKIWGFFWGVPN